MTPRYDASRKHSASAKRSLDSRLLAYSAAAGVAIAGAAAPSAADAQIVYTDLDPDVTRTLPPPGDPNTGGGLGPTIDFDFDDDGDLEFQVQPINFSSSQTGFLFPADSTGTDLGYAVVGSYGTFFNYPPMRSAPDSRSRLLRASSSPHRTSPWRPAFRAIPTATSSV